MIYNFVLNNMSRLEFKKQFVIFFKLLTILFLFKIVDLSIFGKTNSDISDNL